VGFLFSGRFVLQTPEITIEAADSPSTSSARTLPPPSTRLNHLRTLESESIYILREAVAEFARPVMLYSIGKDSSVMLRLAQKAFFPGKIPFPLLHVDTGYKFPEMIEFRNSYTRQIGAELIVHKNQEALDAGANPVSLGTQKCCGLLKTKSLLDALAEEGFDAAFGGARRDEEKSRAKERIYSFRDSLGQWDPKNQRPELWSIFNSRIDKGESIRVFPLSNWTELDVWLYIQREQIPIVPLYFAREREVARVCSLHRCHPLRRGYLAENHRRDVLLPPLGTGESRYRP
jgi:sulfate adenylyltransferase subunit 2